MKAAVFKGLRQPLVIEDVTEVRPGRGQVRLRVHRCGICGSDLHMTEDPIFCIPSGTVLGHEFAGEVVECGPGIERLRVGDRVSVLPIASCGKCAACLSGHPVWCAEMQLHGGGYGEYAMVNEIQCVRLPSSLSEDDGALVEPLAVGLHGVIQAEMKPGASVLIIGAGPIGLATAFWARRLGAGTIASTASSTRRADLTMAMGTDMFIAPEDNAPADVARLMGGAPDFVFECVGKPGLIDQSVGIVRPRGTVMVLGLCTATDQFHPFNAVNKEVRILTAAFYGIKDFEMSAKALDADHVAARDMITDHVSLDELPGAFEALKTRTNQCKVMVKP